jgi:hypothetical protein
MKNNKAFQTLVGLFVLFLGWKLWETGWVSDMWGNNDPEAVESVDLIALFIGAAISAVQLVGIFAIGLVAGFQPLLESALSSIGQWRTPKASGIDQAKLIETLQLLSDRLDALDSPDGKD